MNFKVVLPEAMVEGAKRVRGEIQRQLEQHGRSVETVGLREAKALWAALPISFGDFTRPDGQINMRVLRQAEAALARRLAEERKFDVVIFPALQLRHAMLGAAGNIRKTPAGSRDAIWDGVWRKVEVLNPPRPEYVGRVVRQIPANGLSVRLVVYPSKGDRLFESYGGLEFPLRVVFKHGVSEKEGWRYTVETRQDLLTNPSTLREGVAIAFDPYLPETAALRE